jgi:16S rRNA C967 or C1407 C5-methylase (RsmB/RsmF family)
MVEENELIVERFLRRHPEFTLARICPDVGVQGLRGLDECRRLFPHLHGCNGFFVARLKRLF